MRMRGWLCGERVVACFKDLSHNYLGKFEEISEKSLYGKFCVLAKVWAL
jgi:hypothetical protein